jgi:hypothetical protein
MLLPGVDMDLLEYKRRWYTIATLVGMTEWEILQFLNPIELENDYQSRSRKQIMQILYRFWIFQSTRPCNMVGFGLCKVRCGGTVHCDSDTRLSGLRLALLKSNRRQVVCTLLVVGG